MASVLVVGATSALGNSLSKSLIDAGYEVLVTSRREEADKDLNHLYLDLAEPLEVERFPATDFVVIAAGVVGETACSKNPNLSRRINVEATIQLAREFVNRGSFVLFISSSRVFDGRKANQNFRDELSPRGVYGQQKAEAESQLLGLENVAVLRMTKLMADRDRLVDEIASRSSKQSELVVYSNVMIAPVTLDEANDALIRIMNRKSTGLFQLSGEKIVTEEEYFRSLLVDEPERLRSIVVREKSGLGGKIEYESLSTYLPTVERQYEALLTAPRVTLGLMSGHAYVNDPKRLSFTLSRYKFVSKMFAGAESVLEVGCADAFGTPIVREEVDLLVATDFDPTFISDARTNHPGSASIEFMTHDFLEGPIPRKFDAAYALDVLEHIPEGDERVFLGNVAGSLGSKGMCIVGMPSLESQIYASEMSRRGHVNCKSAPALKELMSAYFDFVFLFSMSDEVVHTGFTPMAQYLIALGCQVSK